MENLKPFPQTYSFSPLYTPRSHSDKNQIKTALHSPPGSGSSQLGAPAPGFPTATTPEPRAFWNLGVCDLQTTSPIKSCGDIGGGGRGRRKFQKLHPAPGRVSVYFPGLSTTSSFFLPCRIWVSNSFGELATSSAPSGAGNQFPGALGSPRCLAGSAGWCGAAARWGAGAGATDFAAQAHRRRLETQPILRSL